MIATSPAVGFIGAGQLGEPVIGRLLASGQPVRALARRADVGDRLAGLGATVVDTPAAAAAEIVVLFVFSDEQLLDVALGNHGVLAAMPPSGVLVVHTTAALETVQRLATEADTRGVTVLDAPVSGTADDIRAGRLTVLVGGDEDAVGRCLPVFAAYADPVLPVGPLGSAMKVKLVNNILFAAQVQLAADAARLAGDLSVDPMRALNALLSCSGASTAMMHLTRSGDVDAFGARVSRYLRKDVAACAETSAALGVDLGLLGDVARRGPLDLA
jgi:3-hydroxyisobutyrate dehydrogenase-like beta-hydroxyacid dehydrogenase